MTVEAISAAVKEAHRFISAVSAWERSYPKRDYNAFGNKHTGAIRRVSLDLTRKLAEMRKA